MMLENNNITNKTQEKVLINDEKEIEQTEKLPINKGNIKDRITSGIHQTGIFYYIYITFRQSITHLFC
jgi:hypothetical protein